MALLLASFSPSTFAGLDVDIDAFCFANAYGVLEILVAHEFLLASSPIEKYMVGIMLLTVLLGGCGFDSDIGTVSGIVTLDGSPLEGASITFLPEKGRPSSGGTDKNGHYKLSYSNDKSGAILGECQVTITTAFEDQDGKRAAERVPKKYRAPAALKANVKQGSNKLNFELLSK